jgi:hypothetical protein
VETIEARLALIRGLGMRIWTDDGTTIRVDGLGQALPPIQREWLRVHKGEVLAVLVAESWDPKQATSTVLTAVKIVEDRIQQVVLQWLSAEGVDRPTHFPLPERWAPDPETFVWDVPVFRRGRQLHSHLTTLLRTQEPTSALWAAVMTASDNRDMPTLTARCTDWIAAAEQIVGHASAAAPPSIGDTTPTSA